MYMIEYIQKNIYVQSTPTTETNKIFTKYQKHIRDFFLEIYITETLWTIWATIGTIGPFEEPHRSVFSIHHKIHIHVPMVCISNTYRSIVITVT